MNKTIQQNAYSQVTKSIDVSLPLFPDLKNHNLGPPQKARVGSEGAGGETPPCLYSNISIGNHENDQTVIKNDKIKVETILALTTLLTPYHKKAAQALYMNVVRLVKEVPNIGHIAFLTITFKDNVKDHREAYRRYRSWNTNFFSKHPAFGYYINTKEVQTRGAWHFHILVQLKFDIRDGFDFEAYREWLEGNNRFNKKCPTGNDSLRALWADLRENLEPYGLGKIHSLEPVESTVEAIGRYVGKYISKHIGNRTEQQKGVRLVNYSRGWLRNSSNFAWYTEGSKEWRRKLKCFAMFIGCQEFYQISEKLGPNWAYKYAIDIHNIYKDCETIYENKDVIFESPTIKRISGNKIQRQKKETKTETEIIEKKRRAVERKKQETKSYMKKLTSEYVENWLSELKETDDIETALDETKQNLENYHMKKRAGAVEDYRNEQSIWILNTGEVIPF
jgi:hypothetical protein